MPPHTVLRLLNLVKTATDTTLAGDWSKTGGAGGNTPTTVTAAASYTLTLDATAGVGAITLGNGSKLDLSDVTDAANIGNVTGGNESSEIYIPDSNASSLALDVFKKITSTTPVIKLGGSQSTIAYTAPSAAIAGDTANLSWANGIVATTTTFFFTDIEEIGSGDNVEHIELPLQHPQTAVSMPLPALK